MPLSLRGVLAVLIGAVALSGCATIGPNTISPDRRDYVSQIGESAKEQVLLNIVKMRYLDSPTFLDVSSIINQYGLEKTVGTSGLVHYPKASSDWWNVGASGSATYSDRPTITYTPMTGKKFTQNLLTPIPPSAVVGLIQSGWFADLVLRITLNSINGVENYNAFNGFKKENMDFDRLLLALRNLQAAGISDIRAKSTGKGEEIQLVFDPAHADEKNLQDLATLRRILNLQPDQPTLKVVYGVLPSDGNEIALSTRPMMAIMLQYGAGVEVPAKDLAEGRARPVDTSEGAYDRQLVHIHSGRDRPADAFASVIYRGTTYWIDDRDLESKKNFTLLMILLSLTEVEQKSAGPLVTVGA